MGHLSYGGLIMGSGMSFSNDKDRAIHQDIKAFVSPLHATTKASKAP